MIRISLPFISLFKIDELMSINLCTQMSFDVVAVNLIIKGHRWVENTVAPR